MIGVITYVAEGESPTAALENSTLLFSSQLDGSPNSVITASASQPVPLTPGFIHHKVLGHFNSVGVDQLHGGFKVS